MTCPTLKMRSGISFSQAYTSKALFISSVPIGSLKSHEKAPDKTEKVSAEVKV